MKKLLFSLSFLMAAAFVATGFASAQTDLQVMSAHVQVIHGDSGPVKFLYVTIQNNGPDTFKGSFDVRASNSSGEVRATFSGTIGFAKMVDVKVSNLPKGDTYSLYVELKDVLDVNDYNNYLYFDSSQPQIRLISSGLIANELRDTLFLTPGEIYGEQFGIKDLNHHNSIIGVDFQLRTYDLGDKDCYFSTNFEYVQNIREGHESFVKEDAMGSHKSLQVTLLANNSQAATNFHYLGYYWGFGNYLEIGQSGRIYISAEVAQNNLEKIYISTDRVLYIRDAIRGDITGDGLVDNQDFELLKKVVDERLYDYWQVREHMYTRKGINYGAGRILFSQPDFLSVALLNIWLNNPNDELVQGLGIGKLMSETMPGSVSSSIMPINNTFSVENGEVSIEASGADVYNVVAQGSDGRIIQRTGRLGESINLPLDAKNIHVETVKIKGSTTGLFSTPKAGVDVSIFPNPVTDYLQVSSPESGKISVINLNGQEIHSSPINANEMLHLDAQTWTKGIYLVKIVTTTGQSTVKVTK